MLHRLFQYLGKRLACYLTKPSVHYLEFSLINMTALKNTLQPGDVLLVEGNSRISTAIKYLTQSTWSHACIYIGDNEEMPLIEADLQQGVIRVPLSKYLKHNLRICRPINLTSYDKQRLTYFVIERLGDHYDLKNIFDLMRYLIPTPPIPSRFRRQMIAFGSGDPTKAICSTLIAQAFQHIRYPILPRSITINDGNTHTADDMRILESRHYSHFTPRDFDLSPYFALVKPTIEDGFNYQKLHWITASEHARLLEEQNRVASELSLSLNDAAPNAQTSWQR